jgi:hypothetical protein
MCKIWYTLVSILRWRYKCFEVGLVTMLVTLPVLWVMHTLHCTALHICNLPHYWCSSLLKTCCRQGNKVMCWNKLYSAPLSYCTVLCSVIYLSHVFNLFTKLVNTMLSKIGSNWSVSSLECLKNSVTGLVLLTKMWWCFICAYDKS